MSAGIFSSQKGQEAVYSGLEEARASMAPKGSMYAYGNTTSGNVTAASFTLTNALEGQAIDLTPNDGSGDHVTVISYTDDSQHVSDVQYAVTFIGKNNGDVLLEDEEQAVLTIDLSGVTGLGIYDSFNIEVKPVVGAALILERTLPGRIDAVMDLN